MDVPGVIVATESPACWQLKLDDNVKNYSVLTTQKLILILLTSDDSVADLATWGITIFVANLFISKIFQAANLKWVIFPKEQEQIS